MGYLCPFYSRNGLFFLTDFSLKRNYLSANLWTEKKIRLLFPQDASDWNVVNPCQHTAPQWPCSARAARSAGGQSFRTSPLGINHCPWHCCQMKKRIRLLQNKTEGHISSREKLITRIVRHTQFLFSWREKLRDLLGRFPEGGALTSTSKTHSHITLLRGFQYFCFWTERNPGHQKWEKQC